MISRPSTDCYLIAKNLVGQYSLPCHHQWQSNMKRILVKPPSSTANRLRGRSQSVVWFSSQTTILLNTYIITSCRYLQLLCSHPTLGRAQTLADFLSPAYVTPDRSHRKGIFAKLAESFSGPSQPAKVPLRDIEEFFQNERDWSTNYSVHLKTTLDAVLTVIHSEKSNRKASGWKVDHVCHSHIGRLRSILVYRNHRPVETSVHGAVDERPFLSSTRDGPHPSSAAFQDGRYLSQYPGTDVGRYRYELHAGSRSIDCLCMFSWLFLPQDLTEDGLQRGLCDFYCIWDLYHQYLANEQLMLNRRTALLVNYENANRNWDKAKAHKRDEVRDDHFSSLLPPRPPPPFQRPVHSRD